MKKATCLVTAILVLSAVVPALFATQNPVADKVLQALQTSFSAENSARARHLAFAIKADQEGYGEIASLFRAAAKAEGFHARNFEEQITRCGGVPQVKLDTPIVKSTKENLEVAIQAETYERDTMYPEFRKLAQDRYEMDALRTINLAYNGEMSHVTVLTEAYTNLEAGRGAGTTYYVCAECGPITKVAPNRACHSCYGPAEGFQRVS